MENNEIVRVLVSTKNHNSLIFTDAFVRYLSVHAPEVLDEIEPELMTSLLQSDVEITNEIPELLFGYSTVEEFTLSHYRFTKLDDGKIVYPKWDLNIVRLNPEVLKYVEIYGSSSFVNSEIPFEIMEISTDKFDYLYEEDDGSECMCYK